MSADTTVKIFIASSAEVKEEREGCIRLINQLNKSHKHLNLEPILWEYDVVDGSFYEYKDIQGGIDPKLKECQLVIFIFYSRIGKYTHQEFELSRAENKKLFALFKQGFSAQNMEQHNAYGELIKFKAGLNDTVLYKDYNNIDEFEKHLYQQLNLYFYEQYSALQKDTLDEPADKYSNSVSTLIKLLAEKEEEIKDLKQKVSSLPALAGQQELLQLLQERDGLKEKLLQNEQIQQQQAKDKETLEQQLAPYKEKDSLKAKALEEVERGNYNEAEAYLKESAKASIAETASTFYELAKIKELQLSYAEAFNYYELASKVDNTNALYLNKAGELSWILGFSDKAVDYHEKALAIRKQYYGEAHPDIAISYNNIGLANASKGEYNKAIDYHEKALAIYKQYYGEAHPDIAISYNNIGAAYDNKGKYDKAIDFYNKSLAIRKQYYGEAHPSIAISYNNIGLAYANKGEYDKAIAYLNLSLQIFQKFISSTHPNLLTLKNNIESVEKAREEK